MANAACFSVVPSTPMDVKKRSTQLTMKILPQRWMNNYYRISACRSSPPFNVFICHRGSDTKRNIAALFYDRLVEKNFQPFLDYKSMKPGEALKEAIETALRDCKVGLVILSPNFCSSEDCLHELASMIEFEKRVIPIFYDVRVSDLAIVDDGSFQPKQLHRFCWALEMAKARVGISFNSCKGSSRDWPDLLKTVSDWVVEILKELEVE